LGLDGRRGAGLDQGEAHDAALYRITQLTVFPTKTECFARFEYCVSFANMGQFD
jgi:hypothetical protein